VGHAGLENIYCWEEWRLFAHFGATGVCTRQALGARQKYLFLFVILIRETSLNLGAITAMIGEKSAFRSLTFWEAVWGNRATRPQPEHEPVRLTAFQSVYSPGQAFPW